MGRVWPRPMHRGRPLNLIVRRQLGGSVASEMSDFDAASREFVIANREMREANFKLVTGKALPPDEPPLCDFCGAGHNTVRRMFAGCVGKGKEVHICSECIRAFSEADVDAKGK